MLEKRKHKRFDVSMKLVISSLFRQNKIKLINIDTPIEIVDFSKSGIGFRTTNILPIDYYFNAQLQFGDDESATMYCIIKIIRADIPDIEEELDENDFDCAFDGDENHMINYGCEIVGMSEIHEQILSQYTEILDSEDEEI